MSAWAAARELGDGARSMSAVYGCEVSGLGVVSGGSVRKLAHTGERFVGCGDDWHILLLSC